MAGTMTMALLTGCSNSTQANTAAKLQKQRKQHRQQKAKQRVNRPGIPVYWLSQSRDCFPQAESR